MPRGSKFKDLLEIELKDPEFAAAYLASALDEGDEVFLSEALANVTKPTELLHCFQKQELPDKLCIKCVPQKVIHLLKIFLSY
jgi:hypothetical protein